MLNLKIHNAALIIPAGLFFCLFAFVFPGKAKAQTVFDSPPPGDLRSFDDLFPGLGGSERSAAFGEEGYICSHAKNEPLELSPAPGSGIGSIDTVMKTNPSYLAESLLVIPYSAKILERLDAYNALGRIADLKGRLYHSFTRNQDVPLFEDATRLDNVTRANPIGDPAPAKELPPSETVYMRLKDVNFGNSYYRLDMSAGPYGLSYSLSNFKVITYLIFTVMKEGKFGAVLYLEPLKEGMLVYSVAGAEVSDFIASKIDIPSAIEKRLAVFVGWVSDGIKLAK